MIDKHEKIKSLLKNIEKQRRKKLNQQALFCVLKFLKKTFIL